MMIRILIADDESVVRMSLSTIVDWSREGFEITGYAQNGAAALDFLQKNPVDVLLTDIRMPGMDGIELLRHLPELEKPPIPVVLSAYEDFSYVRQAFKLGAVDYLLKSDITPSSLLECVKSAANRSAVPGVNADFIAPPEEQWRLMALGTVSPDENFLGHTYLLAGFEVDDFGEEIKRYGSDMARGFIQPMLSCAGQVPRVASRCRICSVSPSRYLLLYPVDGGQRNPEETLASICTQMIRNWKNYMNAAVTAGVGPICRSPEQLGAALDEVWETLSLKLVLGRGGVYTEEHRKLFSPAGARKYAGHYGALVQGVKAGKLSTEVLASFTAFLYGLPKEEVTSCILGLICHISTCFIEAGDDILYAYDRNYNFHEKLTRLETVRDMEIWLGNFLRWLCDYVENHYQYRQTDIMVRAKRFIGDHFSDPAISLGTVANYVGFSEKYFSTRFGKETGQSFSAYLNELRIAKAKELMDKTDLKMYEICDRVGFNNVEHFTRVFKKTTGITPSSYKRKQ